MTLLRTSVRLLLPILLLFSLMLLFRGHDDAGGGFVGGLVAALALALHALAHGAEKTRSVLRIPVHLLLALGLGTAIGSGMIGVFSGRPFLQALWLPVTPPALGHLGTPVLFDIGVYLTVAGAVLIILFSLMEAE